MNRFLNVITFIGIVFYITVAIVIFIVPNPSESLFQTRPLLSYSSLSVMFLFGYVIILNGLRSSSKNKTVTLKLAGQTLLYIVGLILLMAFVQGDFFRDIEESSGF